MSLAVKSKTPESVFCEVVDGGELKSRRHLNVRGKSATLPSITGMISQLYSIFISNPHVWFDTVDHPHFRALAAPDVCAVGHESKFEARAAVICCE